MRSPVRTITNFVLLLFSLLILAQPIQADTLDVRITAGIDDVEESTGTDDGRLRRGRDRLDLVYRNTQMGNQRIGLRFQNITIPKDATINSAYIEFTARGDRTNTNTLTVYGDDVGDAPPFQPGGLGSFNVANRIKTAGVSWSPGSWSNGGKYQTTDVKSIVSAITSRGDWSSGNSIAFIIEGTGRVTAYSRNGNTFSLRPRLVIDYSPLPPPPPEIQLNKSQLDPVTVVGTDASPDTFIISNSGGSDLNYTLSSDVPAWLQLAPAAGTLAPGQQATIDVSYVGSDALASGTHTGIITAFDGNAVPTTETINVTLQAGRPEITIDRSVVPVPIILPADTTNSYSFTVTNSGNAPLVFSVDKDAGWVSLGAAGGTLDPGDSTAITLDVDTSGMSLGSGHNCIVMVSDPEATNNPQTFQVDLVISEVTASGDGDNMNDAEEYPGGGVDSQGQRWDLDFESNHLTGIRFPNVNVQQGTVITGANILLRGVDSNDTVATNVSITAEDHSTNNPPIFTTTNSDISGRLTVGSSVPWNTIPQLVVGNEYQTPDLMPLVQPLVSRPDWNSGQSMAFIISSTGERDFASYDHGGHAGPLLRITAAANTAPLIVLDRHVIDHDVDCGTILPPDAFDVFNKGNGTLTYSVSSDVPWMSVAPGGGGPLPNDGSSNTFTITYDMAAIFAAPGNTLEGTITVTDPAARPTSVELKVTLIIDRPAIQLSTNSMSQELRVGQTAAQQFTITNPGSADLNNYTISAIDNDTSLLATWMSVPNTGGPLANDGSIDTITVNLDATGLTAGSTYTGTITVADPTGCTPPQVIDVTLLVGDPHIELVHNLPATIIMPADYANTDYSFTVGNSGNHRLEYSVNSSYDPANDPNTVDWMSFTPGSGVVEIGAPVQTVTINLDSTDLIAGNTYNGTITVSDPAADNNPQTIPITIAISNRGEYSPGASNDDAEEDVSDGDMYLTSSDLEMVADWGTLQTIGIKFNNVNIPSGSLITNAYIQFMADNDTSGTVDLEIYGENTGDAQSFSSIDNDISTRPLTTTKIPWNNIPDWNNGSLYNSPDISSIIQEIVNNPGWQFNNNMAFIIKGEQGRRRAHSYDEFISNNNRLPPRLVIEWVQTTQPYIYVEPVGQLGVVSLVGTNAGQQTFTLMNTGAGDLNYTISMSETWLSCTPSSGTLARGTSQEITVVFGTTSMAAGNYSATVTISDTNAFNNPYEYMVNLQVDPVATGSTCGEVPIYAQNIINPAILVQLDTSGSMRNNTDTNTSEANPKTPNLRNIFQSMLGHGDWTANVSDVVFFITGAGNRTAISYDGASSDAPVLHINYYDPSAPTTLVEYSNRITQSSDDAEENVSTGNVNFTSTDLELTEDGSNNQVVGLRFQNINVPSNAVIDEVYISFARNVTTSTPTSLTIEGEDVSGAGNNYQAETFESQANNVSSRTRLANIVSWNNLDTWWGDVRMPRYKVGRAVIADLVKDRTISWGFGTWDSVNDGPQWSGSGSGPDLEQVTSATYDKTSPYYLETPYIDEYGATDENRWDLFTEIRAHVKSRDAADTVDLQNTILATTTGSGTPLGPSMLAARAYFKGQKKAEDGSEYNSGLTCQPKFLINITDGQGYLNHTTSEYTERYAHWLADSEITAVVIGFDLSNSSQIDAVAQVSNSRGQDSGTDHLYSIHKDRDGDGDVDSFSAASGEELKTALEEITDTVKKQLFYGSAPAPSTSVDMGSFVIVATFNPETGWSGDLKALPYNPVTGQIEVSDPLLPNPDVDCASTTSTCWRAGHELDKLTWGGGSDYAKAFTVEGPLTSPSGVGTGPAVSYTQTTLANDNYICKGLGDIIKSTPKIIDKPKKFYPYDNYRVFQSDTVISNRIPLVAIGSNDGALHFFNLESSVESHRFYPLGVHGTLSLAGPEPSWDTCDEEYCHRYMVDGSPTLSDIFISNNSVTTDAITGHIDDSAWRTILITGLGRGGNSYFAIDTTYNNPFDSSTNPSVYLWNYEDIDLGLTIANPYIARVNDSSDDSDFGGWAVFFGSGYSETDQVNKESYLFGLKAWDATRLWNSSVGEKIRIEEDDSIDYEMLTADFTAGETVTGGTSGATATIVALTKLGTSGTLKLSNISGTFVSGEDLTDSATGVAKMAGTIHSSYRDDALNTPVVADIDYDDISDHLYVGTLHGRMHRVTNFGLDDTPSVACMFDFGDNQLNYISGGTAFQLGEIVTGQTSGATGEVVHFEGDASTGTLHLINITGQSFQTGESLSGDNGGSATANGSLYRADLPIRAQVDWAFHEDDDKAWIYFGTGRFESQLDKTTTNQNYFAAMVDSLTSPTQETYLGNLIGHGIELMTDDPSTTIDESAFFRYVVGSNSNKDPWYLRLLTGGLPSERVITQPLVVGGLVFFQTFMPDNDPCAGNGASWLYVLDYETGLPPTHTVFDINGDGEFNEDDLVDHDSNPSTDPVVVVGVYIGRGTPTGLVLEDNILFAGTSDGGVGGGGGGFGGGGGIPINPIYRKAELKSWRDKSL